jgi:hypothetical protein
MLRNVSNANPSGGIKAEDNAAFGVRPQGYVNGESVGRIAQGAAKRLKTLVLWRHRGRLPHWGVAAHAIVVTSPHNWARRRPPGEPR